MTWDEVIKIALAAIGGVAPMRVTGHDGARAIAEVL